MSAEVKGGAVLDSEVEVFCFASLQWSFCISTSNVALLHYHQERKPSECFREMDGAQNPALLNYYNAPPEIAPSALQLSLEKASISVIRWAG